VRRISLSILSIAVLVASCFSKDDPTLSGSIRGEVVTVAQNGEPAVSPHARIVLHGPVNKETESDAHGAFAIDGLPPGLYNVEASAPGLNAAAAVDVKSGTSSVVPLELNISRVKSQVTVTATETALVEESAQKGVVDQKVERAQSKRKNRQLASARSRRRAGS
jgi:hypothetical protein